MEGFLDFVHRQIHQAARDAKVKAVVVRINSPGGTITASDDLYRRLAEVRTGNPSKDYDPKPLVCSMGGIAASGGYYIAMPARPIFAERSSVTGSIGVYAAFPNLKELSEKIGFSMETIKQGEIKDSGSPFKKMTEKEHQVWQDMVDHSYQQFLQVVESGRTELKGKLLESFMVEPVRAGPSVAGKPQPGPYPRYRADGGIFTADKALELKLVDQIGTLDDAIKAAARAAQVGDEFQAIRYEKPKTFAEAVLGIHQTRPTSAMEQMMDPTFLSNRLAPRIWYLAPGYEWMGLMSGSGGG
jgi:protease-4